MAQMREDMRAEAAKYYDVNPTIPDDLAFYRACLPSSDATVLELGLRYRSCAAPAGDNVRLCPWDRSVPGHARALPLVIQFRA